MPRFTLMGILVIALIYVIGARYPVLAQKAGLA